MTESKDRLHPWDGDALKEAYEIIDCRYQYVSDSKHFENEEVEENLRKSLDGLEDVLEIGVSMIESNEGVSLEEMR